MCLFMNHLIYTCHRVTACSVLCQVSPGDTGWDVFSLDYHVDGPIRTVSVLTAFGALLFCIIRVLSPRFMTKKMHFDQAFFVTMSVANCAMLTSRWCFSWMCMYSNLK